MICWGWANTAELAFSTELCGEDDCCNLTSRRFFGICVGTANESEVGTGSRFATATAAVMAASCGDGELAVTAVDRFGNAEPTVDAMAVVACGESDVAKTGQEN